MGPRYGNPNHELDKELKLEQICNRHAFQNMINFIAFKIHVVGFVLPNCTPFFIEGILRSKVMTLVTLALSTQRIIMGINLKTDISDMLLFSEPVIQF